MIAGPSATGPPPPPPALAISLGQLCASDEVAPRPGTERRGMVAARLATLRLGGKPARYCGVESDVEEPFMKAKLLACILVVGLSSPVLAGPTTSGGALERTNVQ